MTIKNFLDADQPAGTSLSFTISNVENPYSTVPRSGFIISTLDVNGGYIDQLTTMTYTVSQWGTLSDITLGRLDGTTTVQEASQIYISFKVPYYVE